MLGVKARIIRVAAGLGFSLLETGCRSQSSPEAHRPTHGNAPRVGGGGCPRAASRRRARRSTGARTPMLARTARRPATRRSASMPGRAAQARSPRPPSPMVSAPARRIQASNSLTTDGFDSTRGRARRRPRGQRRRQHRRILVHGLDHRRQSLDPRQRDFVQSQRRARGSTPRWDARRRRDVHRRRQRLRRQYAAWQREGPGRGLQGIVGRGAVRLLEPRAGGLDHGGPSHHQQRRRHHRALADRGRRQQSGADRPALRQLLPLPDQRRAAADHCRPWPHGALRRRQPERQRRPGHPDGRDGDARSLRGGHLQRVERADAWVDQRSRALPRVRRRRDLQRVGKHDARVQRLCAGGAGQPGQRVDHVRVHLRQVDPGERKRHRPLRYEHRLGRRRVLLGRDV